MYNKFKNDCIQTFSMPTIQNDKKSETKIVTYANGRKVKRTLKDHEIDMGERGIYNKKNRLNDLTGKEWTYFINSVIETKYSANGDNSYGHNLRKQHPSPKPPQLMADIISFFTKSNGKILDPFMGVGGTLLGASLLKGKRKAIGVDLVDKYLEIYAQVCEQEKLTKQIALEGDARDIDSFEEIKNEKFDLILTDPPYANMLSRKRTGGDRKQELIGKSTPFTNDNRDLGNISYQDFFPEFNLIIEKCVKYLKPKGHLVIFCKDLQPNENHHNMLHADLVSNLSNINSLQFKGYKIWYDKTINLYPYGYPFSFVANQLHQYILVFQKVN